jgi:hypothetical protein
MLVLADEPTETFDASIALDQLPILPLALE